MGCRTAGSTHQPPPAIHRDRPSLLVHRRLDQSWDRWSSPRFPRPARRCRRCRRTRRRRSRIRGRYAKYFTGFQILRAPDETGSWAPDGEPHELSLLPDRLGFIMKQEDVTHHIVYNQSVGRFELTGSNTDACVSRMPLARVAPPSSAKESAPSPRMRIGIPSWN